MKRKLSLVEKDNGTVALFLLKTYDMIEKSPYSVATWMDDGTQFVVKDPKEFARLMLPKYFKHSNFSSFVRQLNFYGFRKHKKDSIVITSKTDHRKDWWIFYHNNFVRGKQHLMSDIRRRTCSETNTSSASSTEEVQELKSQVTSLNAQVSELTGQVKDMKDMLNKFMSSNNSSSEKRSKNVVSPELFPSYIKPDNSRNISPCNKKPCSTSETAAAVSMPPELKLLPPSTPIFSSQTSNLSEDWGPIIDSWTTGFEIETA